MSQFAPKIFLAERPDGLGQRLCTIVNAIYLSQRFDCQFAVRWPVTGLMKRTEFHTVPHAHEIFSAEFLNRFVTEEEPDRTRFINFIERGGEATSDMFRSELGRNDIDGWIGLRTDLRDARDASIRPDASLSYSEAFRRIGFTDAIAKAVELAREVPLSSDVVALHARGGDLVYGKLKRFPRLLTKAIPAPLASAFVRELRAQGRPVIVFGQEPETIALLERHGARGIHQFCDHPFDNKAEQDLFEIVLMSRCEEIYSGESGFSQLAAMIGDRQCINPMVTLNENKQYQMISRELFWHRRDHHPLAAAAAWKYLHYFAGHSFSPRQRKRMLKRARRLDPENSLYVLSLAAHYFHRGHFKTGDRLLGDILETEHARAHEAVTESMQVLRHKIRDKFLMESDFPAFESAADAGMPYARLYHAHLKFLQGDFDAALRLTKKSSLARKAKSPCGRLRRYIKRQQDNQSPS
jgi:hypothetical protein